MNDSPESHQQKESPPQAEVNRKSLWDVLKGKGQSFADLAHHSPLSVSTLHVMMLFCVKAIICGSIRAGSLSSSICLIFEGSVSSVTVVQSSSYLFSLGLLLLCLQGELGHGAASLHWPFALWGSLIAVATGL